MVKPRRNFADARSSIIGRLTRLGPRTATTDTIAMPTQATIDAPSRW